jgi:hypothetical protein
MATLEDLAMKIVRTGAAACLAQLAVVICAALPAAAPGGVRTAPAAPGARSVAVNIVEYGQGSL